MTWHHRQPAPSRYGYDSSPYPNPPHQRYQDPSGPTASYPPFAPPLPATNAYGPPASPQIPPSGKSRDYWPDQPQYATAPSPWRHDHNETRKYDNSQYQSPEARGAYPYQHQTSSSRGGRRLERHHAIYPAQSHPPAIHPSYEPPAPFETKEPRNQPLTKDWQSSKSSSKQSHVNAGTKKEAALTNSQVDVKKEVASGSEKKPDSNKKKSKKDGDLLSLLANVSSEMDDDKKGSSKDDGKSSSETGKNTALQAGDKSKELNSAQNSYINDAPKVRDTGDKIAPSKKGKNIPPTSPVQRHLQRSPVITPNMSTETDHSHQTEGKRTEDAAHPVKQRVVRTLTPKPITPTAAPHYHHYPQKYPETPSTQTSYVERASNVGQPYYANSNSFPPPPPASHSRTYPPPSYGYGYESRDPSWDHPQPSPVVVEHNSFDSTDSGSGMRYHSDYSYASYPGQPPSVGRFYPGENGYFPPETIHGDHRGTGPPQMEHIPDLRTPPSPYPHNSWSYEGHPPPSPMNNRHYAGPPVSQQYAPYPASSAPRAMGYPTPSPYYQQSTEGSPMDGFSSGSPGGGQPYTPPHHMPYPMYHPHTAYPPHMGSGVPPYSYVQQPTLEEKIVLKKKFSWKHFPELERFLIENRDDYLKFSSRNYTVEQKQFNNHLTERLIDLAEKHNYVFDQDDFNFVAIRDRIRCYYKSYVQTARKRGLSLPSDSVAKRLKTTGHGDDQYQSDEHENNDDDERRLIEKEHAAL